MNPRLFDISWQVSEEEYRADPALSYSTLSKFVREGFNKLDTLFDKVETPSLTFGSAVDALITGSEEEFNNRFLVADFPAIPDSIVTMVKALFNNSFMTHRNLADIPDADIIALSEELGYQKNWRPETRARVIKEQGGEYYRLLYAAQTKTILDQSTYNEVLASVDALRNNESTKFFFAPNSPFNDNIVREYQLKFKAALNGIDFRCMADLILVDHVNKIIYPIDLKTSSHPEWDFFLSFVQWRYDIQGRLYWRIIRHNLDKSPVFKDYKLANYTFVVVNRKTLTPLAWEFMNTQTMGTLVYGEDNSIKLEDPFEIAQVLKGYLEDRPPVPIGIIQVGKNDLDYWLNTMRR